MADPVITTIRTGRLTGGRKLLFVSWTLKSPTGPDSVMHSVQVLSAGGVRKPLLKYGTLAQASAFFDGYIAAIKEEFRQ